ncbi:hypothetical protein HQ524_01315 [Candidatus Uhrbacteria bacterium]|nr:hypothetical protein [Candidatus Uhrbacteria bacterium]
METDAINVLQSTFQDLIAQIMGFLPQLLGAIFIIIIGAIIAWALQLVVKKIIAAVKIDDLLGRLQVASMFKKAGINLHVGKLLSWIVKWFVIILFIIAAADVLGWGQVTLFLGEVIAYIPNVLISVVILLVGIVLGSFVYDVVTTAVRSAKLGGANLLAGISKWSIFVFAFIAAMQQLGIASALLQILTTGLVAMLALAGGLAFGLGGQDHAKKFLAHLQDDITKR